MKKYFLIISTSLPFLLSAAYGMDTAQVEEHKTRIYVTALRDPDFPLPQEPSLNWQQRDCCERGVWRSDDYSTEIIQEPEQLENHHQKLWQIWDDATPSIQIAGDSNERERLIWASNSSHSSLNDNPSMNVSSSSAESSFVIVEDKSEDFEIIESPSPLDN